MGTSSYQNSRKQHILTELASVLGQLCNDVETRTMMSDDFPVVPCLLWVNDQAAPNTKLKAKLLFALRQLAASGQNKLSIGKHATANIIEQIAKGKARFLDCIMNAVTLLLTLASVRSNVLLMIHQDRLTDALEACGLQRQGREAPSHGFGAALWEKVKALKERVKEETLTDAP